MKKKELTRGWGKEKGLSVSGEECKPPKGCTYNLRPEKTIYAIDGMRQRENVSGVGDFTLLSLITKNHA